MMPFYRDRTGSYRKTLFKEVDGMYAFDTFDDHCIKKEFKFLFFPKRCCVTGKKMWLTKAYKRTAMWTGPGEPLYEHRWYDKDQYLFLMLKGEL